MFVKLMLKDEEKWYTMECLDLPKIPFLDNNIILGNIKYVEYKSNGNTLLFLYLMIKF